MDELCAVISKGFSQIMYLCLVKGKLNRIKTPFQGKILLHYIESAENELNDEVEVIEMIT